MLMCTSQRSLPPASSLGAGSDPTPESLQGERKLPSCIIIGNILHHHHLAKIPIFDTIAIVTIPTKILNANLKNGRCAKRRD